ncbi:MAG TPA: hypothetical protein VE078_01125 [Thermoanaerobaculia bacterium]|nr:hypothetical protein [Thermoanaerobaculia bacterium]
MKEVRAIVLGLLVVVVAAIALAFWRRPAPEFKRIKGYRVEVRERHGDSVRKVSFTVPSNLVARVAKFAPIQDIGGDLKAKWDDEELSARDILDAADRSAPGQPGLIERDDKKIEVTADGAALEIVVSDDWDKTVRLRLPRGLVESFSGKGNISPRDILRRLDELGPGEVITIKDGTDEVTITAEAR